MTERLVTEEYLDKSLEKLGGMIKRSFDDVDKRLKIESRELVTNT
jgi:hypothetical protein